MFMWAPESLQFLALRNKKPATIAKWLKRVDPSAPVSPDTNYEVREQNARSGLPVFHLFREGRAAATTLLWIANFLNVLNAYFLASWLPTVVRDAGHPTSTAVLVGTSVQVGGTIGGLVLGWFVQRLGFVSILTTCFLLACGNLALIGQPALPLAILFTAAFLAGLGIFGGQAALNALEATYYPTSLRSTGVGSGLAIGRVGAIIGPTVAGALMGRHWTTEQLFNAAAIPALISALAIFSLRWFLQPRMAESLAGELAVRQIR
jgi:AAHS family 4-hydroxybenzoate transporter-like MFS transporter